MSLTANIVLWTVSLFLACSGIIFGVMASYNASKANKNIQSLISTSWIADETQKHFFDNLKNVVIANKKMEQELNSELTYFEYSLLSTSTRLALISIKSVRALRKTEYKDLVENYISSKSKLDQKFLNIIKDPTVLETNKKMPKAAKEKLLKFHKETYNKASALLRQFTVISSATKELKSHI